MCSQATVVHWQARERVCAEYLMKFDKNSVLKYKKN